MTPSIQLYLTFFSILYTNFLLIYLAFNTFGRPCAIGSTNRFTAQEGPQQDQVAVDEIVSQLDCERYWLYAAVDPDTNKLLHRKLEPVRTHALAHAFFGEVREKHDVDDIPRNRRFLVCERGALRLVNVAARSRSQHSIFAVSNVSEQFLIEHRHRNQQTAHFPWINETASPTQ